ncbi:Hypothetical predicted protein [Octopus vulgaris]|uniref:Uncharacterized protein n=1 Tax=Octopus vulgaris TaxID=6645 RepID=A0AA36EXF1_OCTVU|nr:Hypothetical predicted protein [Octopus vulgaris]
MPTEEEMLKEQEVESRNNKVTNFAAAAGVNMKDLNIDQKELVKYKGLIQREGLEVKVIIPSEVTHNASHCTIVYKSLIIKSKKLDIASKEVVEICLRPKAIPSFST